MDCAHSPSNLPGKKCGNDASLRRFQVSVDPRQMQAGYNLPWLSAASISVQTKR